MTEKPKSVTTGQSTRIGDLALAMGAYRFTSNNRGAKWQFEITKHCGGDPLFVGFLSAADLRHMQRVIGTIAEMVETDGNNPSERP